MHELSLSTAILDTVQRHAAGRKVTAVQMRIGTMRQVVPTSLEFYFEVVSRDTEVEGARLEQEIVDAELRCGGCGHRWRPDLPYFRCSACEGVDVEVLSGTEFEVDSIVVEEPDDREGGGRMHRTKVRVTEDALDANSTIADANRHDFDHADVRVVNLMSAPGAGKTTLLERTLDRLDGIRAGVLEGDVQGSFDADRLAQLHVPVTQLNTDPGFGGECHLDANMVRSAIPSIPLEEIDLLVVENVGNLVCPAEFRVGEDTRAMVCSITEGEDKPLKYPLMFRTCDLVVVNKIDLLPHLDFDVDQLLANVADVNPGAETMLVSAQTGEGTDAFRDWLARVGSRESAPA